MSSAPDTPDEAGETTPDSDLFGGKAWAARDLSALELADLFGISDRSIRDLVARGLAGVKLVTSDAHAGLVAAIGATLEGAAWQRCRTHYAANLMSITPKTSWPWVKTMLHSIYDQPDAPSVHAQFDRVINALAEKLPAVADHLEGARADILAFTAFPKEIWRQIWSNNPILVNRLSGDGLVLAA